MTYRKMIRSFLSDAKKGVVAKGKKNYGKKLGKMQDSLTNVGDRKWGDISKGPKQKRKSKFSDTLRKRSGK